MRTGTQSFPPVATAIDLLIQLFFCFALHADNIFDGMRDIDRSIDLKRRNVSSDDSSRWHHRASAAVFRNDLVEFYCRIGFPPVHHGGHLGRLSAQAIETNELMAAIDRDAAGDSLGAHFQVSLQSTCF